MQGAPQQQKQLNFAKEGRCGESYFGQCRPESETIPTNTHHSNMTYPIDVKTNDCDPCSEQPTILELADDARVDNVIKQVNNISECSFNNVSKLSNDVPRCIGALDQESHTAVANEDEHDVDENKSSILRNIWNPLHMQSSYLEEDSPMQPISPRPPPKVHSSIWKSKNSHSGGLTLSAYRRPETAIRLTSTDSARKFSDFFKFTGKVLGHGAFSTVRLAIRKVDDCQVAVKTIAKHEALRSRRLQQRQCSPEHSGSQGQKQCYLEEWEILKKLQHHPHVVDLIDLFETSDEIQIVTEFCKYGELFDTIQRRHGGGNGIDISETARTDNSNQSSCHEGEAASVAGQILHALADLHSAGIVHKDVKPENILLVNDSKLSSALGSSHRDCNLHVKLCDFGVARPMVVQDNSDSTMCVDGEISPMAQRSRSFSIIGTDYYAAPELTFGGTYDTAVDIYSLGVSLYILLCGFPPVFAPSYPCSGLAMSSDTASSNDDSFYSSTECDESDDAMEVLFPDKYWSTISFGAKDLLRKMLHTEPSARVRARDALADPWIKQHYSSRAFAAKTSVGADTLTIATPNTRVCQTTLNLSLVRSKLHEALAQGKIDDNDGPRINTPLLSAPVVTKKRELPQASTAYDDERQDSLLLISPIRHKKLRRLTGLSHHRKNEVSSTTSSRYTTATRGIIGGIRRHHRSCRRNSSVSRKKQRCGSITLATLADLYRCSTTPAVIVAAAAAAVAHNNSNENTERIISGDSSNPTTPTVTNTTCGRHQQQDEITSGNDTSTHDITVAATATLLCSK